MALFHKSVNIQEPAMENLRATGRRLKHALLDKASKLKKTVGLDRFDVLINS